MRLVTHWSDRVVRDILVTSHSLYNNGRILWLVTYWSDHVVNDILVGS